MTRKARNIFILSLSLLAASTIAAYLYIDSVLEYYKPSIESMASRALGSTVVCEEMQLSLFPPSIKLRNVHIGVAGRDSVTVRIPAAFLKFDLFSLSTRSPQFHELVVDSPVVALSLAATSPRAGEESLPPVGAAGERMKINLQSLVVKEGRITVTDIESNEVAALHPVNLRASLQFESRPERDHLGPAVIRIPNIEILSELSFSLLRAGTQMKLSDLSLTGSLTHAAGVITIDEFILDSKAEFLKQGKQTTRKNIPLKLNAGRMRLDISGGSANTVEKAALTVGDNTVELDGFYDSTSEKGLYNLNISFLDVLLLEPFLPRHPLIFTNVVPELEARIELAIANGSYSAAGSLKLAKLALSKPQLELSSLRLEKIKWGKAGGDITISAELEAGDFALKVSEHEGYRAKKVAGPISVSLEPRKGGVAQGDLAVERFAYFDKGVEIDKVDAALKGIRGKFSAKGDVDVGLNLDGKSIWLKTENYLLDSLVRVSSPLKISVPAAGGYKVQGPVKVQKAGMTFAERRLENVSGDVEILVSGPSKRFTSQNLMATFDNGPIRLKNDFEMTSGAYILHDVKAAAFDGEIIGAFHLTRGEPRLLSVEAHAKMVKSERLAKFISPTASGNLEGRITDLTVRADGEWDNFEDSLEGRSTLIFEDGIIKRVLADEILAAQLRRLADKKAPKIEKTDAPLPQAEGQRAYVLRETYARKITADLSFNAKQAKTENLQILSSSSTTKLAGIYDFDSGFDMAGSVIFLEQTARMLGGPIPILKDLFGKLGRLELPIKVKGPASALSITADMSRILQTTAPTRAISGAIKGITSVPGMIGDLISPAETSTPTPQLTP
ncbi:MAG: hypothetical protein J5J00_13490 [Deltaproteobacteria bacterium]|nr:hypothetical protein [Deltaproteobacteria bacterium]